MTEPGKISPRAAAIAVIVALMVGVLVSLAIRPPGAAAVASQQAGPVKAREQVRWKLPIALGTNLPALGDNVLYVAGILDRASSGDFKLDIYEPGELVPSFSIVDAVREKKVQSGYTWLGYDQGKIPASPLISAVPFGFEPWEFMAWWYEAGGRQLGEALYHRNDIHPLLCGLIGPETAGWFRDPIDDLADLEGLKIRFAGLGGEVMQQVGASVTMLPGSEIFQALEKGAIDATEFSLPVVDQALGFDRVAKYNYFPGWHQPFTAFHLVVNLDLWNGLPEAHRNMLELACTAGVTRNLARSEALQGEIVAAYSEKGVTAGVLARDVLEELRRVTNKVLEDAANDDVDFAEILASQRTFRRDYKHWKRVAYLPRDFE